ncbi:MULTISPECIES: polysaccharide deacetylase family protein [unclassified Streptomyces]|uniref:polysaccharide deacetylase family protein n=1 Tax=unclassified Streptomyces TaxID=2593676 RepID=UPI00278BB1BA|nr:MULTISPECIES: polysaccharide deacetylase family protein [unclassified Streptomyces]
MTKHQDPTGRRALLRGVTAFGLAALTGCTAGERPGTSPAPAGAAAHPAREPSTYRLRPLAGHGPRRASLTVRDAPILRLDTDPDDRAMALTFDDGPDPAYTPEILRILRRHDVRATFLVCGGRARQSPDLLREMADAGHVIGNHTWTHPLLLKLDRPRIRAEMERTAELIERTIGEPPLWFRAPYGAWNRNVFELGTELGMEPLAWTVDSLDWDDPGAPTVISRVVKRAAPGVIVLGHDAGGDRSQTLTAVRDYLPRLIDAGYRLTVPRPTGV